MATPVPTAVKQAEGEALARLLAGFNQKELASKNSVPGGPSMLSQNLSGNRAITLEGAMAYAAGLNVPVHAFSPRIQAEIDRLSQFATRSQTQIEAVHLTQQTERQATLPHSWPFPNVSLPKLSALKGGNARLMEAAMRSAAEDIGIDILESAKNAKSA